MSVVFEEIAQDSIRQAVNELDPALLNRRTSVSQPVNPSISYASTHGCKDFDSFLALKALEEKGLLADKDVEYGRYGSITTAQLESELCDLEHAEAGAVFNTGMSAIATLFHTLLISERGPHHIIVGREGYRKTRELLSDYVTAGFCEITVIEMSEFNLVAQHIKPLTRMIFFETPSNPFLRVIDVAEVSHQVKAVNENVLVVVDPTFSSPYNQRVLEQGADLVVPSLTKYVSGHNNVLGGAILGNKNIIAKIVAKRGAVGSIMTPETAERIHQGLKTFDLRMQRLNENGLEVAQILERHPRVDAVYYPGLTSSPEYAVARKQMSGFGGVVTFKVGRDLFGVREFINAFVLAHGDAWIAPSFGGTEAFISPVAVVSHFRESPHDRAAQGISDDLVRLSVGTARREVLIGALQAGFDAVEVYLSRSKDVSTN